MGFYSFYCVDVAKHLADFALESRLFSEYRLRSEYNSASVLVIEVVLEEKFDLSYSLPSEVRGSPNIVALSSKELIIVKVLIKLNLEKLSL